MIPTEYLAGYFERQGPTADGTAFPMASTTHPAIQMEGSAPMQPMIQRRRM